MKALPFEEGYDIIECRKLSDDLYECSVTIWHDNHHIKFNEGHFKDEKSCLERCLKFAKERIINGISFEFFKSK